jgi:hypothetical protein
MPSRAIGVTPTSARLIFLKIQRCHGLRDASLVSCHFIILSPLGKFGSCTGYDCEAYLPITMSSGLNVGARMKAAFRSLFNRDLGRDTDISRNKDRSGETDLAQVTIMAAFWELERGAILAWPCL